ncbi:MAG: outer membrane beta-barrel protein [Lutibacter sp.]
MKLKLILASIFLTTFYFSNAQEPTDIPSGKVTGKVFFNHHIDISKDAKQTSNFELQRAYLGYKHKFNDKFSSTIMLDAGNGSGVSDYGVFIKNAKLDYKANEWLSLTAGLFGMVQFDDQEKFWGYRYLYKTLDDEYKLGTSADLGVGAKVKINNKLTMAFVIVNGDGYKRVQDPQGNNRYGAKILYKPSASWIFKAYYDIMKGTDLSNPKGFTNSNNLALFAGYRYKNRFRMGAEFNKLYNGTNFSSPSIGKNLSGISLYSTFNLNNTWNIFGRFDQLSSNTLDGQTTSWHYSDDRNNYILGFEYKASKNINTSLNYRYTDYKDSLKINASLVYLNLEFSF